MCSVALLAAGCAGGSTNGADAGTSDGGGGSAADLMSGEGVIVQGTVILTGSESVDSGFSNEIWTAQETCAQVGAQGSGGGGYGPEGSFQIPGPYFGTALDDGTELVSSLELSRYTGPGDYDEVSGALTVGDLMDGHDYEFAHAATVDLTIGADGSGTLNFTDVPRSGDDSATISGDVTWTCMDGGR